MGLAAGRAAPRPALTIVASVAILLVLVALSSCAGKPTREPTTGQRVLLVGIDGATMRAIEPLMAAGELPNLTSLARAGVSGRLTSAFPLLSPRIWTTIATGKRPAKHGIENWVKPAEDGKSVLYYSYDRVGHALWNIVSDAGLRVAAVNWLITYPPEEIDGVMVSDHAFPGGVQGKRFLGRAFAKAQGNELEEPQTEETGAAAVFPERWAAKVRSSRHEQRQLTPFDDPFTDQSALPPTAMAGLLSGFYQSDQQLVSVALEIEAEVDPDVLMVLLQGIDRISHFLWGFLARDVDYDYPADFTRPTPAQHAAARDALLTYYRHTDALIGLLVERFDDDDLVIVVSDHGFEPAKFSGFVTGEHNSVNARDGVIFARGLGIGAGASAGAISVDDITPTILAWLGLAVARDMDGKPAGFLPGPFAEPIATYDTKPIKRMAGSRSGAESQVMDNLRALGYVD